MPTRRHIGCDNSPSLFGRITDPALAQGELAIGFGEGRTVEHRAQPVVATSFPQAETRRTRVRDDVATDRFGRVLGERHPVRIRHDLIRDEDRDTELFR